MNPLLRTFGCLELCERCPFAQVARVLTGLRCSWITATVLRRDTRPTTTAPVGVATGKRARRRRS